MELWDIYDADKKPTGRTMKRNEWCLKDGEYHLTVLGVIKRTDCSKMALCCLKNGAIIKLSGIFPQFSMCVLLPTAITIVYG